jgi:membrane-bound ClpP family serine protease
MKKSSVSLVLHHLVGEVCCVTQSIRGVRGGSVRIWGSDFRASAESHIPRGMWVRVISHSGDMLNVVPLNVWLGSCCC